MVVTSYKDSIVAILHILIQTTEYNNFMLEWEQKTSWYNSNNASTPNILLISYETI